MQDYTFLNYSLSSTALDELFVALYGTKHTNIAQYVAHFKVSVWKCNETVYRLVKTPASEENSVK